MLIEITGERVTLPQSQDNVDADGEEPENKDNMDAGGEEPENKDKKVLAVLPEYGICRLVDKVTYRIRDIREFWVDGNVDSFKANIINWAWSGENSRYEFYRDDELAAYVSAMYYVYAVDDKQKGSQEK